MITSQNLIVLCVFEDAYQMLIKVPKTLEN